VSRKQAKRKVFRLRGKPPAGKKETRTKNDADFISDHRTSSNSRAQAEPFIWMFLLPEPLQDRGGDSC
jgi:hypothetical protein